MTETSAWPAAWADLYDAMDVDRRGHVAFYAGLVGPSTRALLDLGCGTGSITTEVAGRMGDGARVTGVDLSPRMIEIARARAPRHDWRVGDIAAPPVEGAFDLAMICFHTVQALLDPADLARCFAAARARLAEGGRFAFDLYNPNEAWLAGIGPGSYVTRSYRGADGREVEVVEGNGRYDAEARVLSGSWRLRDAATGDWLPVDPIVQTLRQYDPAEVEEALRAAGLGIEARYGDLAGGAFTPGSKHQIYVCRPA